jgi:serine protease Do
MIPVNGHVLQPAKLAESPALKVGQLVLAVGYPDMLDEQGGLFSGLISGLNRTVILENGTAVQMIQTNAPISQICSGGPLINLLGEVIGLTNCNLAYESYDGMNYALPVDAMRAVAANLSDAGYVPGRAWLGITVLSEASFLELQYLYRFPNGLYVSSVVKDSPAYAADLRKGDVIVQINDAEVGTGMDLSAFLQTQSVGSLLRLRVYRRLENQTLTIQVYLKESVR